MIQIRNRYTDEIILEVERGTDLSCADLSCANLRDADLRDADLRDADLRGANLRGTDLRDAIGNNREIKTLQLGEYITVVTKYTLSIGCQQHTLEEWEKFSDIEIRKMEDGAVEWWGTWKEIIMRVANTI